MVQQRKELATARSKVTGTLGGLLAVMLMVGLSQVKCALDAVLSAAARVVLGAAPELLLSVWHLLQPVHSCVNGAVWEEILRISGSWWPVIAALVTKA